MERFSRHEQEMHGGMSGAERQTSFEDDAATIAEQFVRARLESRALKNYPGVVPPDLDAAYRCQESAIERWPS